MTNKKKLAVVLGGWHYPYAYYKQVVDQKIPDGWEVHFGLDPLNRSSALFDGDDDGWDAE